MKRRKTERKGRSLFNLLNSVVPEVPVKGFKDFSKIPKFLAGTRKRRALCNDEGIKDS